MPAEQMDENITAAEKSNLVTTLRVLGCISIAGCVAVLIAYLIGRRHDRQTTIGVHMVAILQGLELVRAIFMTAGPSEIADGKQSKICKTQGFFLEASSLCVVMWTCCLSSNLSLLLTRKSKADALLRRMKPQFILTCLSSVIMASSLVSAGEFNDVTFWCWVDDGRRSKHYKFMYYYAWVTVALIFVAYNLVEISSIKTSVETRDGIRDLQLTMLQYMCVFAITSVFGIVSFFVQASGGRQYLWCSILAVTLGPLSGFLNSLIYFGAFNGWNRKRSLSRRSGAESELHEIFQRDSERKSATDWHSNSLAFDNETSDREIFVTTFNMGEGRLEDISSIDKWIPKGYDIYAIGVQECLVLPELRELLKKEIGSEYTMFTHEIGSTNTSLGFHGMIALTVFARTGDVRAGRFCPEHIDELSQGKKIGTRRMQNKGTVGLSFRYHDTSLAFLTAHLASDSNGMISDSNSCNILFDDNCLASIASFSGKCKVHERDKGANEALARTVLVSDDIGCSVQLQHHHVFYFGDLNYRMSSTSPERVLVDLAGVCAHECGHAADSGKVWREERRAILDQSSNQIEKDKPNDETAKAREPIELAWKFFCELDELGKSLASKLVFYGFRELPIYFPPTYRRSRKIDGGDYSSVDFLSQAFTTRVYKVTEKEKNDSSSTIESTAVNPVFAAENIEEKGTPRVPSYTDRILVHSIRDRKTDLQLKAYESHDCVLGSDHRPVSLWCTLKVSPSVLCTLDRSKAAKRKSLAELMLRKVSSASEASNQLHLQVTLRCLHFNIISQKEAKKSMKEILYSRETEKVEEDDIETGEMRKDDQSDIRTINDDGEDDEQVKETKDNMNDFDEINFSDSESDAEIDGIFSSSDTQVAHVEFILPIPTEDPRLHQRKDSEIVSAFGRKENRADFAQLRRETGTVLNVKKDLANTTRVPWKKFEAQGMRITANVRPEFGLHGLFKLTRKDGKTLGSGVVCLRELMRKQEHAMAVEQTETEDVPLVVGGQLRGSISLSVKCQKLRKMESNFAIPDSRNHHQREAEIL